jgi:hypothetical protein
METTTSDYEKKITRTFGNYWWSWFLYVGAASEVEMKEKRQS